MKRSVSIDALKGIAALLVVCLHCENSDTLDSVIHIFARMAVPMFYLITGYFIPDMIERNDMKRHFVKILKITLFSLALYFILFCIESIATGAFPNKLYTIVSWKSFVNSLILGRTPFSINAGHLWYLVSIIYILGFISIYTRKYSIKSLYYLIPILFLSGYIISSITGIKRVYYQNYLFIGLPYVLLGSFIKEKMSSFSLNKKTIDLLLVLLPILLACEIFIYVSFGLPSRREHYLLMTPYVALLLIWSTRHPTFGEKAKLTLIGRRYSLYIYIIHFYIVQKMWLVFHGGRWDSKWQMLTSLFLSLTISYMYYHIKNREKDLCHD